MDISKSKSREDSSSFSQGPMYILCSDSRTDLRLFRVVEFPEKKLSAAAAKALRAGRASP